MRIFGKKFNDKKVRKYVWLGASVVFAFWFVFRFVMVGIESHKNVFNPVREMAANGVPVKTMVATRKDFVIKLPIVIQNNVAYVSGARRAKLKVGQNLDKGEIVSVAKNLDFDTGMYTIKTRGAENGINFVSIPENGFFVPAYAVQNGHLFVVVDGVAARRAITTCGQDSDFVCVQDGIQNGDIIILSKVEIGQKVQK